MSHKLDMLMCTPRQLLQAVHTYIHIWNIKKQHECAYIYIGGEEVHVHCKFISIMTSTTDNCAEIFLIANSKLLLCSYTCNCACRTHVYSAENSFFSLITYIWQSPTDTLACRQHCQRRGIVMSPHPFKLFITLCRRYFMWNPARPQVADHHMYICIHGN